VGERTSFAASIFSLIVLPDGSLSGIYRSGNHFKTYWEGVKKDSIELNDLGNAFTLTGVKNKDVPFTISLQDPDGNIPDLNKPPYAGKPKIIQIMGSWCPNCMDETTFLLEYLAKHPEPGFEILGISFERHTDPEKAKNAIRTYRSKMNIPYTIVYGGANDKSKASQVLPMLTEVVAYPTLIFLNAENKVVAIHTGFSGPATTGYENFKREFEETAQQLVTSHE
jgi:thiol-disulfide isomerase/thioredoxin